MADAQGAPVVTASSSSLESHAVGLGISGSGFGTEAGNVRVYVTPAGGTAVLASVDSGLGLFGATGFTVRLSGLTDLNVGDLKVIVAVKGVKSAKGENGAKGANDVKSVKSAKSAELSRELWVRVKHCGTCGP